MQRPSIAFTLLSFCSSGFKNVSKRASLPRILLLAPFWLLMTGGPACCDTGQPKAETSNNHLLIVGSSTIEPLVKALARQFIREHPGVEIDIETGGSGRGVKDTLSGKADIGMVARPLADNEKTLFVVPIARDGAALVVNKANPVSGLSSDQLRAIFRGDIRTWNAVGGEPSQPIELLRRARHQGVTEVVNDYLGIRTEEGQGTKEVVLNDEVLSAVIRDSGVLSILSMAVVEDSILQGLPVKALAINGIAPGTNSIRNGRWPLARALTLVTRSVPMGLTQQFLQYVLSPQSQDTIKESGFIPY
ncbi:MAG: phosphate ABC transporter substrate-binding protein [Desulfuromonadaceae bacterium]|nr:phosphate ABC transporter substrate-binding protein [Desulfuromonadaceae bacterium]